MTQFFSATPDPVAAGGTLQVCFTDAGRPNDQIEVRLHDGEDHEETKSIQLDANGHGCIDWTVPTGWDVVLIEGGGSEFLSVDVTP